LYRKSDGVGQHIENPQVVESDAEDQV
jgi:hypothetical protein